MTKQEIDNLIASAPRTNAEMLANRRVYLLREGLKDIGASTSAFADFLGMSRLYVERMAQGKEPVTVADISLFETFKASLAA